MSHSRAALIAACALIVVVASAPPRPQNKCEKDSKMVQQEKSIIVRRVPVAYVYPFSLWPVPKYPPREDREDPHGIYHYRRSLHSMNMNQSKR